MAYTGPKGPVYPIEQLLVDYNLCDMPGTKWDQRDWNAEIVVLRFCNKQTPMNVLVLYEEP